MLPHSCQCRQFSNSLLPACLPLAACCRTWHKLSCTAPMHGCICSQPAELPSDTTVMLILLVITKTQSSARTGSHVLCVAHHNASADHCTHTTVTASQPPCRDCCCYNNSNNATVVLQQTHMATWAASAPNRPPGKPHTPALTTSYLTAAAAVVFGLVYIHYNMETC